jgi:hypothetical protein
VGCAGGDEVDQVRIVTTRETWHSRANSKLPLQRGGFFYYGLAGHHIGAWLVLPFPLLTLVAAKTHTYQNRHAGREGGSNYAR